MIWSQIEYDCVDNFSIGIEYNVHWQQMIKRLPALFSPIMDMSVCYQTRVSFNQYSKVGKQSKFRGRGGIHMDGKL